MDSPRSHRLRAAALALLALAACPAWAHGPELPPAGGAIAPWLAVLLLAAAALYAIGCARLWRRAGRGRGITRGQALRFAAGWLALCAALLPPIDTLAATFFSVHMVQHELLMVVAAPLLATGRPLEAWTWAQPPAWRRLLGGVAHRPALRTAAAVLAHPLAAWCAHAAALWLWHVPALFGAALAGRALHELQHATFLGTALLLWWSILGRGPRHAGAGGLGSLFTTMLHTGALGALLTFAPTPWYPAYGQLADQQLGGLVMWVPGGLAYLAAGLAIVASWLRSSPGAPSRVAAGTPAPGLAASPRPD